MLSVSATRHQCHPKFFGQGKQCVANSYAAMIYHTANQKCSKWQQKDLDNILLEGDEIYYNVIMGGQKEGYLLVIDLPVLWNNHKMSLLKTDAGIIQMEAPIQPYVTLKQAITQIENFTFLTIKCYTFAIIKDSGVYYVFDPHARDKNGLVAADGKATLTTYASSTTLIQFLKTLALDLSSNDTQFEATHINIANNSDTDSDDFEGYTDISDGEYACILQTLQDEKVEKLKQIEEDLSNYINSSSESDTELSCIEPSTEASEDNMPLSKLSRLLQKDCFESEYLSSGSEYRLSIQEKKMLNFSYSDSSLSEPVQKKKRKKCQSKRKRKIRRARIGGDVYMRGHGADEIRCDGQGIGGEDGQGIGGDDGQGIGGEDGQGIGGDDGQGIGGDDGQGIGGDDGQGIGGDDGQGIGGDDGQGIGGDDGQGIGGEDGQGIGGDDGQGIGGDDGQGIGGDEIRDDGQGIKNQIQIVGILQELVEFYQYYNVKMFAKLILQ